MSWCNKRHLGNEQEYIRINNEHYAGNGGEDFISFHFSVNDCSLCVCVCLITGTGLVAGLLLMGIGGCGCALDIMTGNISVLVRSFTSMVGCGFLKMDLCRGEKSTKKST